MILEAERAWQAGDFASATQKWGQGCQAGKPLVTK